jgi:hypothetical protein
MSTLRSTARLTGAAYLALGVFGMTSFLVIRNQLYVSDDPAATAANLVDRVTLARAGVAGELALVVAQAVAALLFYRLFRRVDGFSAGALAAFGFMNSVAILVGAMFSAAAVEVAADSALAPGGDRLATIQLLAYLYDSAWNVGSLFFGLWLMPMGWLVRRSGFMPAALGWILMVGGVGYLANGFTLQLLPDAVAVSGGLAAPATIGEFWMIGYLLVKGVRAEFADLSDRAPEADGAAGGGLVEATPVTGVV